MPRTGPLPGTHTGPRAPNLPLCRCRRRSGGSFGAVTVATVCCRLYAVWNSLSREGSVMSTSPASLDFLGRRFEVGPSAGELIGRPRAWMLGASWAAMAAIGISQYGFGSLVPSLVDRGWAPLDVFWLLATWTVFQACAGFPVAYLRERGTIGPRTAMVAGAVLIAIGPLALSRGSELVALLGYSVLSGTGAGI